MQIQITIDTSCLTAEDKRILAAIAGTQEETKISAVGVEKPAKVQRKVTKLATPEVEVVEQEAVAVTPEVKVEVVAPEVKVETRQVEINTTPAEAVGEAVVVTTPEELNNYARDNVRPEYAPYYSAILTKYGVKKFSMIPANCVTDVKAEIDEIIRTVV